MKVYRTAGLTAVWRYMANVDEYSIGYVNPPTIVLGYLLGLLDKNTVETIAQRTKIIDSLIKKLKPNCIVEIGAGFSSRSKRFNYIRYYELDLPYFKKKKSEIIPFDITKDNLSLCIDKIDKALFILEGVTMYLQKEQVIRLLKQIRHYKGNLLIDFFNKEYSTAKKSLSEEIYKLVFKLVINRGYLFDYSINNISEGIAFLNDVGYKDVKHYPYSIPKTLDALFYGRM